MTEKMREQLAKERASAAALILRLEQRIESLETALNQSISVGQLVFSTSGNVCASGVERRVPVEEVKELTEYMIARSKK